MKLLIYSHFFAPSVGGVETIVLELARGLAEIRNSDGTKTFEVTLATQTAAGGFNEAALTFRVVRQPDYVELWRLIRSCDVLHVAGPALGPLILGRLAGKSVVVEHHGFQTICPNGQLLIEPAGAPCPGHFMAKRYSECIRCNSGLGWIGTRKLWLLTFVRRFLCAGAAANITPTNWLGDLMQLPRVSAIPHGLTEIAAPPRPSAALQRPVIAFLGRLVTTKGVQLLLEAASELKRRGKQFELLIIGDGPLRAVLEKHALDLGVSGYVRFAGRLPSAELEKALAESFVVVIPSLGGEVFGLVVAENMMRALPVLASDLGAFTEVIGDAGLTFRTNDSTDLVLKLSRLLDDPQFAQSLGQRGRLRALDFCSLPRMLDSHASVYCTLYAELQPRKTN
jgi:glycogen(starch) synthase